MLGRQDSEMGTSPEEIVRRIHPEDVEKTRVFRLTPPLTMISSQTVVADPKPLIVRQ